MSAWLDDPMVQAGFAPLAVAWAVAALLARWRESGWPWLALAAALLTTLMLSTGLNFTPLSASRKILLLVLLAPLLGLLLDLAAQALPEAVRRGLPWLLPLVLAASVAWIFQSLLQRAAEEGTTVQFIGLAVFVAVLAGLVLRLREDGAALASATLGLGLAVGVSALLAASIGTLMNGMSLAAAGGALLLVQWLRARGLAGGYTGGLGLATAAALMAAGTFMLAELRWPSLVALCVVPVVAAVPLGLARSWRWQLSLRALASALAALLPIALAWWLATRGQG